MVEEGLISIRNIYTDGTKIEANANKYSFVWGRAIKTGKEPIGKQLDALWQYTQKVAEQELTEDQLTSFEAIDHRKVSQAIEKTDQVLKGKQISKKVKQKLNYARKNSQGV